ncbi:MAG: PAS domain S-box protein [Acidimicrobiales bacterium]|jgi:diguanylate cyclase (GGDEF)-like protein/PAS domain S-box-containing protein|nr:PAS domain S-box protein [Acidimicrobiales bacterium]
MDARTARAAPPQERGIAEPLDERARDVLGLVARRSGHLLCVVDERGRVRYVSDSVRRTLGYEPEDFADRLVDLVHPDDLEATRVAWVRLLAAAGCEVVLDFRVRHVDGDYRWIEGSAVNALDRPDLRGVVWDFHDVTARRTAERELVRNEARVSAILEQTYDVFFVVDDELRIGWASPRVTDSMGWDPDELVDTCVLDYVHPDDCDHAAERLVHALSGELPEDPVTVRARCEDGRWLWVDAVGADLTAHAEVDGLVLCLRDVTHRQEVELARRASESRFRALVQHGSDLVLVTDDTGAVTYVSPSVDHVLGVAPDDLLGWRVWRYVHRRDVERLTGRLVELLETPRSQFREQLRMRAGDGQWRWVDVVATNQLDNPAVAGIVANVRDVTEQIAAEGALRRNEERFRALLHHATDAIVAFSADGVVELVSPDTDLLGHPASRLVGTSVLDLVHPEDRPALAAVLADLAGRPGGWVNQVFRSPDATGRWHWIDATVANMLDNEAVQAIVANCRDVTDQREARRDATRLLEIFEITADLVAIADPEGRITHVNAALRRHLGLAHDEQVSTLDVWAHFDETEGALLSEEVQPALIDVGIWSGELTLHTADGQRLPVLAQFLTHRNPDGSVHFYSAVLRDISDRKALEARLEHEATHDPLTGLPNRTLLRDRLTMALARARRHRKDVAVLFLDLDHFKVVNDSRGHSFGDRLLQAIASRLRSALRPEDTVARFGGDEFVVLCEELSSLDEAITLGERIQGVLASQFDIDGIEVFLGASIGVAYHGLSARSESDPAPVPEGLLREADTAMYRAKELGRGGIVVFDERLRSRNLERLELETALRRAVERGELVLHYQPIVDLETGWVVHLEALLRWRHPHRGLLQPAEFIHLAEDSGLIVPIGAWVLDEACGQLASWTADGLVPTDVAVSVNLSGRQLDEPSLPEQVAATVARHGVDPGRLVLEITESVLMQDVAFSQAALARLHRLEVRLAVDDFGTGYSSLSYLRSFPVDMLKIDRSFVSGLGLGGGDEAIVVAIVRLARSLGLEAIAEGVEADTQRRHLLELGCHLGQGHCFAPALAGEEIPTLVADLAGTRLPTVGAD